MPIVGKWPADILAKEKFLEEKFKDLKCIKVIEDVFMRNYVSFDGGITEYIQNIWEEEYDELQKFIQTGQATDSFREQFMVNLEEFFDGSGPCLNINLVDEDFCYSSDKNTIFSLNDWEAICDNASSEPFGYTKYQWGKIHIIFSGFYQNIG